MVIFYFIILLLIPLSMIFLGFLWTKAPPKSVNSLYGYRTSRSMKSKATWEFAHKYFGEIWWRLGATLMLISLFALFFMRNLDIDTMSWCVIIITIVQVLFLTAPIIPTEIVLKKKFDKNGKPF